MEFMTISKMEQDKVEFPGVTANQLVMIKEAVDPKPGWSKA